jgi:hypothetical protein
MLKTMRTISSRYKGGRRRVAKVSKLYEAEQESRLGGRECECEMFVGLGKSLGKGGRRHWGFCRVEGTLAGRTIRLALSCVCRLARSESQWADLS